MIKAIGYSNKHIFPQTEQIDPKIIPFDKSTLTANNVSMIKWGVGGLTTFQRMNVAPLAPISGPINK